MRQTRLKFLKNVLLLKSSKGAIAAHEDSDPCEDEEACVNPRDGVDSSIEEKGKHSGVLYI